jgi:hypothetical protein
VVSNEGWHRRSGGADREAGQLPDPVVVVAVRAEGLGDVRVTRELIEGPS